MQQGSLQKIISRREEGTWHVREYDATSSFNFLQYFTLEFLTGKK
jgi:hypothetical protein